MSLPAYAETAKLLTCKQVMELLGVKKNTLFKFTLHLTPDQRLPSYKVGKSRKYKFDEVMWWIDKQKNV